MEYITGLLFGAAMSLMQGYVGRVKLMSLGSMAVLSMASGAVAASGASELAFTLGGQSHYWFMGISFAFPACIYVAIWAWKELI